MVVQPTDQKIIVAGDFTTVGGLSVTYLCRLNTDGTVDTTFEPNPNAEVASLYLQPDGQVVIGGSFTALTPSGATAATTREDMARITAAGALDTSYNPNLNGEVYAISPATDGSGKLLIGGAFSALQPGGKGSSTIVGFAARLNADGTCDTAFNPNANSTVFQIQQAPNGGEIYMAGLFTTIQPNAGTTTVYTRNFLAKVNTDGTADTNWGTSASSTVNALSVQADGSIIIGGLFTSLEPLGATTTTTRNHVARLLSSGQVDSGFDPDANGSVQSILLNTDGSVLIGGTFTTLQPNGAIVVGGTFTSIAGATVSNLARLSIDGAADTSFAPNPDGTVNAIVYQADGNALIGGAFANIGGVARANLARLNGSTGVIDTSYTPTLDGQVETAALQPDGKVVIGGAFTHVNGVVANHIARLTPTGALDTAFVGNASSDVVMVTLTANGQILAGGAFASIGGGAVANFARLTPSGAIDGTFTPNANGPVSSVALAADGSMIVGGNFTSIGGGTRTNTARLLANGTLDTAFKADATGGTVNTVLLQSDGKSLFGGSFTTLGGLPRNLFGRLSADGSATQSLGVSSDGSTITWTRGGSSPELSSVLFETSPDTVTWGPPAGAGTSGIATRIPGTPSWTLSGIPANANSTYFIRARGVAPSTKFASASLIEDVQAAVSGTNSIGVTSNITTALQTTFGLTVVANAGTATSYTSTTLPLGLTLNKATGVITGLTQLAGVYPVTVSATTPSGTVNSPFVITVTSSNPTLTPTARIPAVTSQAYLAPADTVKTSFTVSGSGQASFLLTGAGPALAAYGVTPVIASPTITFSDSTGQVIQQNNGIGLAGITTMVPIVESLGAVPVTYADAALQTTAMPGTYNVTLSDQSGLGGLGLVQVVNASSSYLLDANWISGHTTQATVYPGAKGTVIVAFNVGGTTPIRLLIRGVGPGLAAKGIAGFLADPALSLYDASGTLLAQNSNWVSQSQSSVQLAASAADIANAASSAGAYPLLATNDDDAIVVTLNPGTYNLQIASQGGNTGTVSAELYQY